MADEVKKETRNCDMHLRITKTEFDELEMASYEKDMSKSDIVRKAISAYCKLLKYAPEVIEEFERKEGDEIDGRSNKS